RLLATVSPRRPEARVSFRLPRAAVVRMEAVRTDTVRAGRPAGESIWRTERRLAAGAHELAWRPGRGVAPRTYVLRLTATDAAGRRRTYGAYRPGRRPDAPVVRVQGVDVATTRSSYVPGEPADLLIASDAPSLRVQVFHYGASRPADEDLHTNGVPVTPPVGVDWRHRDAPGRLRLLRAGRWRSGLYFVRVAAADGRVGYAPFILRPPRLGAERVAVVLATNTWQAYNFHDADGDGWGDSWYVSDAIRAVEATRPYLDFGVPFRFKDWDLAFVAWLNRTGKRVDFLADEDLEAAGTGDALRRAYDLVVFPGHEEYVTARAYDVVERYRDLGGNLLFLAANNFFWRVRREGTRIVRERLWRELGRDEAGLVGVRYVGSDQGQRQAPFTVVGAAEAPWLFAGTGLRDGDTFGRYGIEIDARSPATPAGTRVLAHAPDLMGPGRSAELTYYETAAGARVLAAGAINFVASMTDPRLERMVENAWRHLTAP
ncbi:MAG TPA: N,N-dimethylformamidase beta subunit family domain-containing protein, partial [Gaiellaceae bacterium]|nr:N,N-dimethylformamidase beta subunit family domain-containing protein [Gaiellaceae bacterium]